MSKATRAIIQLVLALALSLTAGVLIFKWMGANRSVAPVAQKQVKTVRALVASRNLPRGARLGPGMLKNATFMPGTLPEGFHADADPLMGQVLYAPVGRNEIVSDSKLVTRNNTSGGVSSMISPGKRAMAVKGNKVLGLSGFIRPGNKVDVLVTLDAGERADKPMTKMVLSNVLVLATGTELEPTANGEGTSSVDTYTLEIGPEEGELLALAATKGSLHFALRNGADNATVLTDGADVESALAAYRSIHAEEVEPEEVDDQVAKAAKKVPPKKVVQLITGSAVSEVSF